MPDVERLGEAREDSENIIEDSRLRDGETPEQYEERLHDLYPEEAQKAYITALMRVSQATVYAQCYSDESEEVKGMYIKEEDGTLYMLEEYAENLKAACDIASLYTKERSKKLVKERRKERERVLSEKKENEKCPASKIAINKPTKPSKEVRKKVKQEITAESLWLATPDATKALKYISSLCKGAIDPNKLLGALITIACAKYEMDVYIDLIDLSEVYRRALRKEAGQPTQLI